ncbi:MAG: AraC family transcriptional regulator [Chitinophagaceae bacterium]
MQRRNDSIINLSIDKTCALTCVLSNSQINNAFHYYSLKLVINGQAIYKLNKKCYQVEENHFLLTNSGQEDFGIIDSKKDVVQFCVHLSPTTIADAYSTLAINLQSDPDCDFRQSCRFQLFENTYSIKGHSNLSRLLMSLSEKIKTGNEIHLNEEWFFQLMETIILQETEIQSALKKLKTVKLSTRNEIMKRLLLAKEYMDAFYTTDPMIGEIARNSMMSEFFFFRKFKQAFSTTPYKYMLDKKIQAAGDLMRSRNLNLHEIAVSTGFPDLQTFSKAYKRKYGLPPSRARRSAENGI